MELKHSTKRKRNKTCRETEAVTDCDRGEAEVLPSPLGQYQHNAKKHIHMYVYLKTWGTVFGCGFCCYCRESRHVSYACEDCRLWTEGEVEQERGEQGRPWQSRNRGERSSDASEAKLDKFGKIAAATVTEGSAENGEGRRVTNEDDDDD